MKHSEGLATILLLVALVLAGVWAMSGLCSFTASNAGIQIQDPEKEARATAIAQKAADDAALRAVQLREAQARAETEERALPAALAGKIALYVGAGLAGAVLLVGLAFAVVAWASKRASTIYPDERGQFPVIVKSGLGWIAYQDPNRGMGPATVIRTPTLLDAFAGVVTATVRSLTTGRRPDLPVNSPEPAFVLPASEDTSARITSQAQAAQLMIAANAGGANSNARSVAGRLLASELGQVAGVRMPKVEVIDDPQEVKEFEQKLLAGGGDV